MKPNTKVRFALGILIAFMIGATFNHFAEDKRVYQVAGYDKPAIAPAMRHKVQLIPNSKLKTKVIEQNT